MKLQTGSPTVVLSLVILVVSIGARAFVFLSAPPLWDDEIFLSLSILLRPVSNFAKLDFQQFAPLGFIWLQNIAVRYSGVGERALRLVPFLGGCLTVVFVLDAARRLVNLRVAVLAAALVGFAPYAIRYSNEAKQYGFEAFITAVLLCLVSHSPQTPGSVLRIAGLIAAGV